MNRKRSPSAIDNPATDGPAPKKQTTSTSSVSQRLHHVLNLFKQRETSKKATFEEWKKLRADGIPTDLSAFLPPLADPFLWHIYRRGHLGKNASKAALSSWRLFESEGDKILSRMYWRVAQTYNLQHCWAVTIHYVFTCNDHWARLGNAVGLPEFKNRFHDISQKADAFEVLILVALINIRPISVFSPSIRFICSWKIVSNGLFMSLSIDASLLYSNMSRKCSAPQLHLMDSLQTHYAISPFKMDLKSNSNQPTSNIRPPAGKICEMTHIYGTS